MSEPFVSMIMPVHNAPDYTEKAVRSVARHTTGIRYELIVVDNLSDRPTRDLLGRLRDEGLIHQVRFLDYNSLYAEGNNIASTMASPEATHFLMLNSDIEVKSDEWLSNLLSVHKRGITTYGLVMDPLRVDGYCLLIDADLYRSHPLDEGHQWWWAVSKTQASLLNEGFSVQGYAEHEEHFHHFGGKSGDAYKHARGMDVTREEVYNWFNGLEARVIDRRRNGSIPGYPQPSPWRRAASGLLRRLTRRG